MNKKVIYILFTFFIFFVGFKTAYADCADIGNKITVYNSYKEKLSNLDCTDTTNEETVNTCNKSKLNKNLIVTELMQLRDNGAICSNYKTQVDNIIAENKDNCGKIFDDDFSNFVNKVMLVFYIVGPILLIFFGTLDYAKAVVVSDPKELKRANQKFIRRIVATILLFLSPIIVNLILSFNISDYYLSGNAYACDYSYVVFNKKWNINYVPRRKKIRTDGNMTIGGITTDAEADTLNYELTNMLNTVYHHNTKERQSGPFPKYWTSPYNGLSKFQCTWWANGRASQYLEEHGTKYTKYPTEYGHGGMYYDVNKQNGYFNYGSVPKPNSIISWKQGRNAGHVAYVEGVSADGIYISHAGSGMSWFGVQKIPLSGEIWGGSGYKLNGYIYLDEPM